jgi:lipid-A-disaccharide synthase
MWHAAALLRKRDPALRFVASAASALLEAEMMRQLEHAGCDWIKVEQQTASELMQRAQVGMIASGTATMEASFFGLPFVLLYKVSWLTYWPARFVIQVNYLGMPNILAGSALIPEFIQRDAKPDGVADAVWTLYKEPAAREKMQRGMAEVIASLDASSAPANAAKVLLGEIKQT